MTSDKPSAEAMDAAAKALKGYCVYERPDNISGPVPGKWDQAHKEFARAFDAFAAKRVAEAMDKRDEEECEF